MEMCDTDGVLGYGDYVLPPHQDRPAGEEEMLLSAAARLPGREAGAAAAVFSVSAPPLWALECALFDLQARRKGVPLGRWLSSDAAPSVSVNAVAALDDRVIASGWPVIKVKVGRAGPEEEAALLHRLPIPAGSLLRLDANCAWSFDQAALFLDLVADLPVDSLEEPLSEPTLASLALLQERTAIDIAVDESLPVLDAEALLSDKPVRRLVLKAGTVGGLRAGSRLAARARASGLGVVITTALDSAIGVAAAAHWAAAAGSRDLAHGLATSDWLAEDVARPLPVAAGRVTLEGCLGLGVTPFAGNSRASGERHRPAGSSDFDRH